MKLLLVGEDRKGALLRSLEPGLRAQVDVTVVDPGRQVTALVDRTTLRSRLRRRTLARSASACFVESVEQLRPDVTLIVKGRGITSEDLERARTVARCVVYYPDNPLWGLDRSRAAFQLLASADLAVVWSHRLRDFLQPYCRQVATVPFGFDDGWFPITPPSPLRFGVAFVGTWSARRERYLRALDGLPLSVMGSGWEKASALRTSKARYGEQAGEVLQRALIGVNILHPHNAGAHNMRTREITASGALQLTDPGTDGTPLRDGQGCRWFTSPEELRELVVRYLAAPEEACRIARDGQELTANETYNRRSEEMLDLIRRAGT